MFRTSILVTVILASVVLGRCTTVIVKFDKDRILIAADTRRTLKPIDYKGERVFFDTACKVLILDRTVMATSGSPFYLPSTLQGPVTELSAYSDAKSAFEPVGITLSEAADGWASRAGHHFEEFDHPNWDLFPALKASDKPLAEIMAVAFFTRWENGSQALETRGVLLLYSSKLQPRRAATKAANYLRADGSASLNGITEELMDAKTDRAKEAAKRWADESKRYPKAEKEWRYLQFLVRETSKIDPQVSPQSDIVAIPRKGTPYWIQQAACK